MKTHVKVLGWLWIANGVLTILIAIPGLIIANMNIPNVQDSILVTVGSLLCCFVPGVIVDVVAGYGLLNYKSWARILAIILAILNLCLFPIGTALGIYTLVIMFNQETEALFKGESALAEVEEISV
jgi:hypothetical protein